MLNNSLKTRFAPSPTGLLHLGSARTALFNHLLAHHAQGKFLLRIEDTDLVRSQMHFADTLQQDLRWLGLNWDEGPNALHSENAPYYQSERQAIYADYYQKLIAMGRAYLCFCSEAQLALTRKVQLKSGQPPRYPGTCRALSPEIIEKKLAEGQKPVLRFRVPEQQDILFKDLVRGEQCFKSKDLGDFIIRRADGTASFMYCNAIDDALMGVTHLLRGEDHLTNTPRQILILQALKLHIPAYGHIALIVNMQGSPLSKRDGSQGISELREQGYLPAAIVNYLARLGHYYSNEQFMTADQLAKGFRLESLSKSPAKYSVDQLNYWQKESVLHLSTEEFWSWATQYAPLDIPHQKRSLFIEAIRPNVLFPKNVLDWSQICFSENFQLTAEQNCILLTAGESYFQEALIAFKLYKQDAQQIMEHLKNKLLLKGKALYLPLRLAITGSEHGPELAKLLALIPEEQIEARLQVAQRHNPLEAL